LSEASISGISSSVWILLSLQSVPGLFSANRSLFLPLWPPELQEREQAQGRLYKNPLGEKRIHEIGTMWPVSENCTLEGKN
jgi:hypothetical protein